MKKAYIGIDSHKEQNTVAVALAGRGDPEPYGKAPADLDAFVRVLRRGSCSAGACGRWASSARWRRLL